MSTSHTTAEIEMYPQGEFHWVGDGFPVRSMFGYNDLGPTISPFLMLDYAAPYSFAPSEARRGVGAHPHRGFETVTIVYQGEVEHRDSSGGGGIIGSGDVQWMTAASGLVHDEFHSERFSRAGGIFEVAQLWVNLPAKDKRVAPGYQTILAGSIPLATLPDGSGRARVISGELLGHHGPAKTHTSINLFDVIMNAGCTVQLPLPSTHSKVILVRRGEVSILGKPAKEGELAVIRGSMSSISLESHSETALLVMTGEPILEPVVGYGPFVMNTEAEIQQAFRDYRMGKMGELT